MLWYTLLVSSSLLPQVLVLTTSNITEAIDIAFVDRADIKQFVCSCVCHVLLRLTLHS